jgi:hypothetical protein
LNLELFTISRYFEFSTLRVRALLKVTSEIIEDISTNGIKRFSKVGGVV